MSNMSHEATVPTRFNANRRERETRPHYLEQTEGEGAPKRIALDRSKLVLGRAEDAAIPIASQRASRQHAVLVRQGTEYTIRDNESRNGVYLNGVKVYSAVLREGDTVQVADCVFIYREG